MDRLVQRNVLATSGRAVEAAGDIDTLLLDKTGTITFGNRRATELSRSPASRSAELAAAARLSSLADQTPEGRSIVALCAAEHGLPAEADAEEARRGVRPVHRADPDVGPRRRRPARSARAPARPSPPGSDRRRGAARGRRDAVDRDRRARAAPRSSSPSATGGSARVLGVVQLSDVVKPGMRRAVRRAAGDGHPHRDDHRRQPAAPRGRSPPRPASTTTSPRPPPRTRWR